MGLILPQKVKVRVGNMRSRYEKLGYTVPTYVKNGKETVHRNTEIEIDINDLSERSHIKVNVNCDECGIPFKMEYRNYKRSYTMQKINKVFCKKCLNKSMAKYQISPKLAWNDKDYALEVLKKYIEKYGTLKGMSMNNEGNVIRAQIRNYKYDLREMCDDLGYNYDELMGLYYPEGYLYEKENLYSVIMEYIAQKGTFPTQNEMKMDLHIPTSVIQYFGGSESIKNDMNYTKDDLIDESGFRNRSHYEYIVAQFLIHNSVTYTREQHPFPKPYQNLRSDFTFEINSGETYHLEIWGYKEEDANGKRSRQYCKKKAEKIELYKKYNINLISIENDVFSNSFDSIQNRLSFILFPILNRKFEIVDHSFLINPNKLSDDELFHEIMKISNDSLILPRENDFNDDNKYLFLEAIKRFGNYGNFAKRYNVCTNNKRGYWSKETVFNRLNMIHEKYGYLPTSIEIRNNKLAKDDGLFVGLVDAMKKIYKNTTQAYLEYYEYCSKNNIKLHEHDTKYLSNLYNLKYFRKDQVTEKDRNRAYAILCA